MLSVEDWAEIRRLHRAERMPIKVIAGGGVFEEHGEGGVGCRRPVGVSTPIDGVGGGCGGAADPGVAAGLSEDAGHGDRGTD